MDLSGYLLERLHEDPDFVLYRGYLPGSNGPILVRAPSTRKAEGANLGRLEHECALVDELDPAWAVRPLTMAHYEGRPVLILEDPGGQTLDSLLGKPLDANRFLQIAVGLSAALRQMHTCGLIHKDIRPANVFVGDTGSVRLTGFGFATRMPRERQPPALPEFIAGTLAYMAPEQTGRMNRSIDNRADLYSLGVTFYEMLVGDVPFAASNATEWISCHIARVPPPPSVRVEKVPLLLELIVLKLLCKNAEDRYQTAAGLEFDLRAGLTSLRDLGHIEPFSLAERDFPTRLLVREKLYGREPEIAALTAAYERVADLGKFEFLLVSGYSGIGKSSVIDEFHRCLHATPALFAAGKFDQYKRDIPYATLIEALQGLVRNILGQDEGELGRWRCLLLNAVGANGQLITDLFPDLGLIIGDQPPPPMVSPQEAKNRFHLTFRRFVGAFAQPEHPLVLFLDDLQWVDAGTLDVMELLAADGGILNLLLVGSYRSNEVEATHRLAMKLQAIGHARGGLEEIELGPLRPRDLAMLIADALRIEAHAVTGLAELVYAKTQGNPFFAVQFLTTLNIDGLLSFDPHTGTWRWDLDGIQRKSITDNVAELMIGRLARYERAALAAVQQLACIGNGVQAVTLARLLGISETEVEAAFREFVAEGLVHWSDRGYAFAHDGVREAAYALIPKRERAVAHLKIGRLLLHASDPKEIEDGIFEIVSQFSRGASLLRSAAERQRLAELYLIAGKRAAASTAYESALTYLDAGHALLGKDPWGRQYRLSFDIELNRSDCRFMLGDLAFAEARLSLLFDRCRDLADLALIVGRQVVFYSYLGQFERAVEISLECLERMGVSVPMRPTPEVLQREYEVLLGKIGGRAIESLADLPAMEDRHWRQVMDVYGGMLSPTGVAMPDLQALVMLRIANISLDLGFVDETPHALACLAGLFLGWRFGSFDLAHRIGRLAMRLVEDRGFDRYASRVYAVISGAVGPWSLPLRDCYKIAIRATEMGREQGGITYSGYAWGCAITALLDSGDRLAEVQRQAEAAQVIVRKLKFPLVTEFLTSQIMLTRALRGLTSSLDSFSNGDFVEADYQRDLETTPHLWHALVRYRIRKVQLLYYSFKYQDCLDLISLLDHEVGPIKVFEIAEYRFFSGLARAAVLSDGRLETAPAQFAALVSNHDQLAEWAKLCPENFSDRMNLVAAEIARLEGRELDAQRLYENAIRCAREFGFVQNEGLANELAARFYASRNFTVIAETYLRNARSCYLRWGAEGKVRQLDQLHPLLRDEFAALPGAAGAGGASFQHLDLAAIFEMHKAVSQEIVLDRLIERLMVTVVAHGGAVRGLLLLPHGSEMHVVAEAVTRSDEVKVHLRPALETADALPRSVLNYVMRTQESIVIDNATSDNIYSTDAYIASFRPRSLLCLPLIRKNRLVGVLYLENDLASHIFNQDRLSVLRLLASQAAISIENAQLFLDIQKAQQQARLVGDELRRSFDMIPALAWRASPNGALEFSNKQWHDYTGLSHEEVRGGAWIGAFHPDDIEKVAEKWRHLTQFGTSGEVEARMRRFDGEFRSFLVRTTPMRDDKGNIVMWHGTGTDIENLKRAEQAQEALARVSRVTAMGELTVSIAHEVNQPLMAIVTNAATCLRWLSDEQLNLQEARLAAERVVRDGHRVGDVIASIRALAKKSSPERAALDLNAVIDEVLLLTRNELDRHAIVVETDLSPQVGPIVADRIQMQQLLLNLIMNGIEAMTGGQGQPRHLRIRAARNDLGHALVSIADTGVGLAPEAARRIFEVFFSTKPDGIGIGLSICRSIVEAHCGRIWTSPNLPNGTVFHFTVPTLNDGRLN